MIEDKAMDLGRLIGQSSEYQALRRAEQSLRSDQDTVSKPESIQLVARQIDQLVSQGKMPDESMTATYEDAIRELELSPVGQAYVVARANFDKLMAAVNQQISAGIDRGAASSIITLS